MASRPLSRRRSSVNIHLSFSEEFTASDGGLKILLVGFLVAVGLGSITGVIPQVTTQGYAERRHGFKGPPCSGFLDRDRPLACRRAGEDAQTAAAYCAAGRHAMAFLCNSVAGSHSDVHGRRGVQILALFLLTMSPVMLILIQLNRSLSPTLYFIFDIFSMMVSFASLSLSMLSDILPRRHRVAAFGAYMAFIYVGISVGGMIPAWLTKDHLQTTIVSFLVRFSSLMFAIIALPETLPAEVAVENKIKAEKSKNTLSSTAFWPLKDVLILGRTKTLLLISIGSCLSRIPFSADVTLFYYYMENVLGIRDKDVAFMMLVTGITGAFSQAVLLKYFISLLGEHQLLIVSFCSSVVQNLAYGFAQSKATIYAGLCMSLLSSASGPLMSGAASHLVSSSEQGQVQGALSALSALSDAIGPIFINFVYRNWHLFGQGTMFIVSAMIYAFGAIVVCHIPVRAENSITANTGARKQPGESTPLI